MKSVICTALLLQAWSASAYVDGAVAPGPFRAPGRLNRMMPRAAGRDCGSYTLDCKGAEGACNNACYHINCNTNSGSNRDRFTYIGPDAQKEQDKNRQQSGCTPGPDGSVCNNFPFSQRFREPALALTDNIQCDEWPMASSIQDDFASGTIRNSLRCIPGSENGSAGSRIGKFILDQGDGRNNRNPQCAGRLQRDDYFTVKFDISNADSTKVNFCTGTATQMCGNDGFQFAMTEKQTQTGKITSPYDPFARLPNARQHDNHYALEETVYPDLLQCSVKLTRNGDNAFEVTLTNWNNDDISHDTQQIPGSTGTATFTGLPLDLKIGKTGTLNSLITFEYGDNPNAQVAYFTWDSESQGFGRGPATDAGDPQRFCKIDLVGNTQTVECWFPCYDN